MLKGAVYSQNQMPEYFIDSKGNKMAYTCSSNGDLYLPINRRRNNRVPSTILKGVCFSYDQVPEFWLREGSEKNKYSAMRLQEKSTGSFYYPEHLYNIQQKYGFTRIPVDCEVHHINLETLDNSDDNLIFITKKTHRRIHKQYDEFIAFVGREQFKEDLKIFANNKKAFTTFFKIKQFDAILASTKEG